MRPHAPQIRSAQLPVVNLGSVLEGLIRGPLDPTGAGIIVSAQGMVAGQVYAQRRVGAVDGTS